MASWEEELAVLLRELGVKQEAPRTRLRKTRKPLQSDVQPREQVADALFWEGENRAETNDEWMDDLNTMRREVDVIVRQVIHLIQHGGLDLALKEDVMIVLRALRRRAAVTQQAATGDEAYLESASALLHFCRLVLQLSECSTEDL